MRIAATWCATAEQLVVDDNVTRRDLYWHFAALCPSDLERVLHTEGNDDHAQLTIAMTGARAPTTPVEMTMPRREWARAVLAAFLDAVGQVHRAKVRGHSSAVTPVSSASTTTAIGTTATIAPAILTTTDDYALLNARQEFLLDRCARLFVRFSMGLSDLCALIPAGKEQLQHVLLLALLAKSGGEEGGGSRLGPPSPQTARGSDYRAHPLIIYHRWVVTVVSRLDAAGHPLRQRITAADIERSVDWIREVLITVKCVDRSDADVAHVHGRQLEPFCAIVAHELARYHDNKDVVDGRSLEYALIYYETCTRALAAMSTTSAPSHGFSGPQQHEDDPLLRECAAIDMVALAQDYARCKTTSAYLQSKKAKSSALPSDEAEIRKQAQKDINLNGELTGYQNAFAAGDKVATTRHGLRTLLCLYADESTAEHRGEFVALVATALEGIGEYLPAATLYLMINNHTQALRTSYCAIQHHAVNARYFRYITDVAVQEYLLWEFMRRKQRERASLMLEQMCAVGRRQPHPLVVISFLLGDLFSCSGDGCDTPPLRVDAMDTDGGSL